MAVCAPPAKPTLLLESSLSACFSFLRPASSMSCWAVNGGGRSTAVVHQQYVREPSTQQAAEEGDIKEDGQDASNCLRAKAVVQPHACCSTLVCDWPNANQTCQQRAS